MSHSSQDLQECPPDFLEKLGFKKRAQITTEPHRLVEWVMPIADSEDVQTAVAVAVLYEMDAFDDTTVYKFWSVSLKAYDAEMERRRDGARGTVDVREREKDFLEEGVLSKVELRIHTKNQLRSLLRLLPLPVHSVKEQIDGDGSQGKEP